MSEENKVNADIFNEERGERDLYTFGDARAEVLVPLTMDGFEALLEQAAKVYNLPVSDELRSVLAAFIHHIPNEKNTTSIDAVAAVLYKSMSNRTTWLIDQQIKAKMRVLADERKAAYEKKALTELATNGNRKNRRAAKRALTAVSDEKAS